MPSPIRPTDDDARALARDLMGASLHAALGVIEDGTPMVTRIAFATGPDAEPLSLISDLSAHTRALIANPACSLLIGEPGAKGDPLTHPRLTLRCHATLIRHGAPHYEKLAAHYLHRQPKAKLYIGFADFSICRFDVSAGFLNGGFGKAFEMTPADLAADLARRS